MRCYISVVCALSVLAVVSYAAPASLQQQSATLSEQANTLLSVNSGSEGSTSLSGRFRRNIQLLRQLCPPLFQVIDNVIQNITSQIFRVVGRVVLQSGGLGGGGGGGGESQVSVVLPTFPPDEDEDEDENEDAGNSNGDTNQVQTTTTRESSFNIRTFSGNRKTSDDPQEIALSVNEISDIPTENVLYTGGLESECDSSQDCENSIVQSRVGEGGNNASTIETTAENKLTELFPRTTEENTRSPAENELITSRDSSLKETTMQTEGNSDTNGINDSANSINALLSGLAEVRFGDDNNAETESPKAQTTTENSLSFDIKVVQQGNVVNTIPIAGDNSVDGNEVDGNPNDTRTQMPFTSPINANVDTVRARRKIRAAEEDQEAAASGGNGPNPAEDLSNVDAEDADRDKRYLPFGGGDGHGAGGGSGNFLFDIIRQTADGAARAAGTVYRMVAGTENLGIGLTASSSATRILDTSATPQLIAGSGATEESDEKENAAGAGGVAEVDIAKSEDGYTEGIPGPITRLFVIANRGLANLIQDLILRLAQTSERIVNFKARLITALI